jgi:hypothetical protein
LEIEKCPGVRSWIISLVEGVMFFIISIAVSFKDLAQQRDGRWKMDPPPRHRRTGDGSMEMEAKTVVNREWEMAWSIGHGAKRPETV